jgi:glutamate decarboxylase
VTFKLKGDPGFDVYHLSSRLREHGWIVPAYNLPPNAENVHLLRIVVRLDLSRQMIDLLLRDLFAAYDDLSAEQPVPRATAKHDLWTAPARAAGKAKSRTKLV